MLEVFIHLAHFEILSSKASIKVIFCINLFKPAN